MSTTHKTVALLTLSLLLLAAVAFWPQYLSKNWSAIDRYTHVHAFFGTLWLFVLIVQPLLVLRGRRAAHRIVGSISLSIAFAFVVSGVLLTHFRVSRMPEAAFGKEGAYIYLPLSVALLFAVACVLGFHWRRSTAVHWRFMVSTALLLADPVLARVMYFYLPRLPSESLYQGITFTLIAIIMALLVRSLPTSAKGRSWYRNYCLGSVSVLALFFVIPRAGAWLDFVRWFRDVPLT
jgi:hypothetical protein